MTSPTKTKAMLSPEELLKPRFKVIADYPHSPYAVGDLLKTMGETSFLMTETPYRDEFGEQITAEHYVKQSTIEGYPHLFQPLPWHAGRKVNDMPSYVKWAQSNPVQVAEVVQWDMEGAMFPTCLIKGECHMRCVVECDLLPVTFDEYITYRKR